MSRSTRNEPVRRDVRVASVPHPSFVHVCASSDHPQHWPCMHRARVHTTGGYAQQGYLGKRPGGSPSESRCLLHDSAHAWTPARVGCQFQPLLVVSLVVKGIVGTGLGRRDRASSTWLPPACLVPVAGTLPTSASNQQVLDSLPVERERGITVKAQVGGRDHKAQVGGRDHKAQVGGRDHKAQVGGWDHKTQVIGRDHKAQVGGWGHRAQVGGRDHKAQVGGGGHKAQVGGWDHKAQVGGWGHRAQVGGRDHKLVAWVHVSVALHSTSQ